MENFVLEHIISSLDVSPLSAILFCRYSLIMKTHLILWRSAISSLKLAISRRLRRINNWGRICKGTKHYSEKF